LLEVISSNDLYKTSVSRLHLIPSETKLTAPKRPASQPLVIIAMPEAAMVRRCNLCPVRSIVLLLLLWLWCVLFCYYQVIVRLKYCVHRWISIDQFIFTCSSSYSYIEIHCVQNYSKWIVIRCWKVLYRWLAGVNHSASTWLLRLSLIIRRVLDNYKNSQQLEELSIIKKASNYLQRLE